MVWRREHPGFLRTGVGDPRQWQLAAKMVR